MLITFLKYMFFKRFCTLSEKTSAFRQKLFGEVVITAFFVSIGSFRGKLKKENFEIKCNFYIFLGDCKESFGGVVNTAFTETIGFLCRSFFWVICLLKFFYVQRNIFGHSSKTLWRGCNHCIFHVQRNVLMKNRKWILRKKYRHFTILGDCAESFGGVVNNAFTETKGSL